MEKRGVGERERYWRGVVERQRRSGQTVLGFCRENGIAQASFYHWRARLASSGRGRSSGAVVPAGAVDAVGAPGRPSDSRTSQPIANGRAGHKGRRVGSTAAKGTPAGRLATATAIGRNRERITTPGSPAGSESATATGLPAAVEKRSPRAASNTAVDSRAPLAEATPFIPLKLPAVLGLGNVIEVVLPRGHLVRVPAGFDGEALRRILELLDAGDA